MFLLVMLVGALVVADILLFVSLGAAHVVPWLVTAVTVAIPFIVRKQESKRFVQWKDEYSVGIEMIDSDHKRLLKLINDLETAIHYNAGDNFEREALEELIAYTQTHFQREEALMEENGYPDFEAHKQEHEAMIAKVKEFCEAYNEDRGKVIDQMAEFLRSWMINHIQGTDQKYVPYMQEKGVR